MQTHKSSVDPMRRSFLASLAGGASLAYLPLGESAEAARDDAVRKYRVSVPQPALDDLKKRLIAARWPEPETVADNTQGVSATKMRALVDYWSTRYDWRKVEGRLNALPQFTTKIDGVDIYFIHVRSKHPEAMPMVMTHGWPGSVVELLKVIDPLTNPTAHGGRAEDAFHLVLPTLPGHGFSGKPTSTGWNRHRVAKAWDELMTRLGYERYVAQGGDWGAVVTQAMASRPPQGLAGIHINMPAVVPKDLPKNLSVREQEAMDSLNRFFNKGAGYAQIQATRPQTIGYALSDSPVGQAAWIYEKFVDWTDSGGVPERVLSRDEMLDDITLYWLTNTGASSGRFYWENSDVAFYAVEIDIPVGVTVFPGELYRAPRSWAELCYHKLVYWNDAEKGGHFAAFEQPQIFVREMRAAFKPMRVPRTP